MNQAIDNYFNVDLATYTDAPTGEKDWGAYFGARDAALEILTAEERERVLDYVHRHETPVQRAVRKLVEENKAALDGYYAIEATEQSERQAYRRENPRMDAALYLSGSTTKLESAAAKPYALAVLRQLFGVGARLPEDVVASSGGRRIGRPVGR